MLALTASCVQKGAVEAPKVAVASPSKAASQTAEQHNSTTAGRDAKPISVTANVADGSLLSMALFVAGTSFALYIVLYFNAKHRHNLALRRRGKA